MLGKPRICRPVPVRVIGRLIYHSSRSATSLLAGPAVERARQAHRQESGGAAAGDTPGGFPARCRL